MEYTNDRTHTRFLVNCVNDILKRYDNLLVPVEVEALGNVVKRLETQAEEIDTLRGDLFDAMEELRAR